MKTNVKDLVLKFIEEHDGLSGGVTKTYSTNQHDILLRDSNSLIYLHVKHVCSNSALDSDSMDTGIRPELARTLLKKSEKLLSDKIIVVVYLPKYHRVIWFNLRDCHQPITADTLFINKKYIKHWSEFSEMCVDLILTNHSDFDKLNDFVNLLKSKGVNFTIDGDQITVNGNLYLENIPITTLPDNLTVGGSLYLRNTPITSLPNNLTVGGSLYLKDTPITTLPDNLTVGGYLYLPSTQITHPINRKKLKEGDYVPNRYVYVDKILCHVKRKRKVGEYIYFEGKIKGKNVISDGVNFVHCTDLRSGISDLEFKKVKHRGQEQYYGVDTNTLLPIKELKVMYRIITGACQQGVNSFVDSLGKDIKKAYTVREVIELTKNQYGNNTFVEFFAGKE